MKSKKTFHKKFYYKYILIEITNVGYILNFQIIFKLYNRKLIFNLSKIYKCYSINFNINYNT